MMRIPLLILPALGLLLSSCLVNDTMRAMRCNTETIEWSSCAISENAQAIEEANRSIQENSRQIELVNKRLDEMNKS